MAKEKETTEDKLKKRAASMAAMGLVTRQGEIFIVQTPSLRGKQMSYNVQRDQNGKVICNCNDFAKLFMEDPATAFRCEHIRAVKIALLDKNVKEAVTPENSIGVPVPPEKEKPATSNPEEIVNSGKSLEAVDAEMLALGTKIANSYGIRDLKHFQETAESKIEALRQAGDKEQLDVWQGRRTAIIYAGRLKAVEFFNEIDKLAVLNNERETSGKGK